VTQQHERKAPMPWLKLSTDITRDFKMRRLDPTHRWIWVACLVIARRSKEPGALMAGEGFAASVEDIADEAGIREPDVVQAALDAFVSLKMMHRDGESYVVSGFLKHQYDHPSDLPDARREKANKRKLRPYSEATPTVLRGNSETEVDVEVERDREPEVDRESTTLSASPTAEEPSSSEEPAENPRNEQIGMFPATALPPAVKPPDPVALVFDAWRESASPNAKLDDKRRKAIQDGLKLYPAGDLVDAVRGWRHDPFSRGENDRQRKYNELTLLLRDAAHIEKFRDLEQQHRPKPVITSELSEQTKERIRLYEAARQRRQAGRWQAQA